MLSISSLTCPTCCDTSDFAFFFFELPALFGREVSGVGDVWKSNDEVVLCVVDDGVDALCDISDGSLRQLPRLEGFCALNAKRLLYADAGVFAGTSNSSGTLGGGDGVEGS